MQHEGHTTEDIDDALNRLKKTLDENTDKIKGNMECIKRQIKTLEVEIQNVQKEFNDCRNSLKTASENLITNIVSVTKEFEQKINNDESKTVKEIEIIKLEKEKKYNELKNLCDLVTATTENSRNVCLLKSLQEGLHKQVKRNAEINIEIFELKRNVSQFNQSLKTQNEKLEKLKEMLGKYDTHSKKTYVNLYGERVFTTTKLWGKLQPKHMNKVKEIGIIHNADRMSFADNNIWVCIPRFQQINIYNLDGIKTRTIKGHKFRAIQKTSNITI
jgi:chromosome segregation ATPase